MRFVLTERHRYPEYLPFARWREASGHQHGRFAYLYSLTHFFIVRIQVQIPDSPNGHSHRSCQVPSSFAIAQ